MVHSTNSGQVGRSQVSSQGPTLTTSERIQGYEVWGKWQESVREGGGVGQESVRQGAGNVVQNNPCHENAPDQYRARLVSGISAR